MSEQLRPMRPIQRQPFAEETLPLSGSPSDAPPPAPPSPAGPGLQSAARVQAYVQDFKQLQAQWPTLSPEDRRLQIQAIANKQLQSSGVPALTFREYAAAPGIGGQFNSQLWTMNISDRFTGATGPQAQALSNWDAKVLAAMVYHESRHAEQWYLAAQSQAASLQAAGGLTPGQIASKLATDLQIPLGIAQQAQQNPLAAASPQAALARQVYDSVYGTHKAAREATLADFHTQNQNLQTANDQQASVQARLAAQADQSRAKAAYQALPEEADAYATGHQVEQAWDGTLVQW